MRETESYLLNNLNFFPTKWDDKKISILTVQESTQKYYRRIHPKGLPWLPVMGQLQRSQTESVACQAWHDHVGITNKENLRPSMMSVHRVQSLKGFEPEKIE